MWNIYIYTHTLTHTPLKTKTMKPERNECSFWNMKKNIYPETIHFCWSAEVLAEHRGHRMNRERFHRKANDEERHGISNNDTSSLSFPQFFCFWEKFEELLKWRWTLSQIFLGNAKDLYCVLKRIMFDCVQFFWERILFEKSLFFFAFLKPFCTCQIFSKKISSTPGKLDGWNSQTSGMPLVGWGYDFDSFFFRGPSGCEPTSLGGFFRFEDLDADVLPINRFIWMQPKDNNKV